MDNLNGVTVEKVTPEMVLRSYFEWQLKQGYRGFIPSQPLKGKGEDGKEHVAKPAFNDILRLHFNIDTNNVEARDAVTAPLVKNGLLKISGKKNVNQRPYVVFTLTDEGYRYFNLAKLPDDKPADPKTVTVNKAVNATITSIASGSFLTTPVILRRKA